MDRQTLIIVLIVVLIVLNMIGGSTEEHFSTRNCKDSYQTNIGGIGACPLNCPHSVGFTPCSGCKKKYKCV